MSHVGRHVEPGAASGVMDGNPSGRSDYDAAAATDRESSIPDRACAKPRGARACRRLLVVDPDGLVGVGHGTVYEYPVQQVPVLTGGEAVEPSDTQIRRSIHPEVRTVDRELLPGVLPMPLVGRTLDPVTPRADTHPPHPDVRALGSGLQLRGQPLARHFGIGISRGQPDLFDGCRGPPLQQHRAPRPTGESDVVRADRDDVDGCTARDVEPPLHDLGASVAAVVEHDGQSALDPVLGDVSHRPVEGAEGRRQVALLVVHGQHDSHVAGGAPQVHCCHSVAFLVRCLPRDQVETDPPVRVPVNPYPTAPT